MSCYRKAAELSLWQGQRTLAEEDLGADLAEAVMAEEDWHHHGV